MKGDKSPEKMVEFIENMKTCYDLSNNFGNKIWAQYVDKDKHSTDCKNDDQLNSLITKKWKAQHPDARYKYQLVKNKSAKRDGIKRIHSQTQAHNYLRRLQYRDSVFNVPIREIIKFFKTWVMDRFIYVIIIKY